MKFEDFVIPETLDEACAKLKELGDNGFAFSGGTSFQYISDRPGVTAVDISRLDLGGIEAHNGSFRVGANTTLTDLVRFRADGFVLDRVATLIPTHQIRNISTVAGNIARLFPWSELPLALLVLDATITIHGNGDRSIGAEEFFAGRPSRLLAAGELITSIEVPSVVTGTGFGYKKESVTNAAFSLMTAAAAVTVKDGNMAKVRLAVGAAVPVPTRLTAVEKALEGKAAEASLFADAVADGIKDIGWKGREGMSDEFGAHLAAVVLQDVLEEALGTATGEAS